MDSGTITVIIAIISAFCGAGFLGFVQFLIQRKDTTTKHLEELTLMQKDIQLNLCRLQLLNLIQHDGSQHEALMVAEHYFKDLHGNFYITSIFSKWLERNNIEIPEWFSK